MAIFSFCIFMFLFLGVGLWAARRPHNSQEDYLLAGRKVSPIMTSLSAAATCNSGFMFIGMIGYSYSVGLASLWLQLGFLVGDYLASLRIYPEVRKVSEKRSALTYPQLLASWNGREYKTLRMVAALLTFIFLGLYAAAQLKAGGKALEALFEWNENTGIILGALAIAIYCWAGGLRASIWTDALQSVIMLFSMALLMMVAVALTGGFASFWQALEEVGPNYTSLFPESLYGLPPIAMLLFFVGGFIFGGYGVSGQPHIMVRFMSMNSAKDMPRFRLYYYSWSAVFSMLAIGCGLAARIVLPDSVSFDAELALPNLSIQILPEILIGFMLAGIFAATMSTADSQILSCSATLAHDFLPEEKDQKIRRDRISIAFITGMAMLTALYAPGNVFSIVLLSWAGSAAAFAPLLTIYVLGGRPSEKLALLMIAASLGTLLLWRALGLQSVVYEAAPGILAGLAVYAIASLFKVEPRPATP